MAEVECPRDYSKLADIVEAKIILLSSRCSLMTIQSRFGLHVQISNCRSTGY